MKKSEKMESAIKAAITKLEGADSEAERTWNNYGLPQCSPKNIHIEKPPFKYGAMVAIIDVVIDILKGGLQ